MCVYKWGLVKKGEYYVTITFLLQDSLFLVFLRKLNQEHYGELDIHLKCVKSKYIFMKKLFKKQDVKGDSKV
jgi:hypothetical protein